MSAVIRKGLTKCGIRDFAIYNSSKILYNLSNAKIFSGKGELL